MPMNKSDLLGILQEWFVPMPTERAMIERGIQAFENGETAESCLPGEDRWFEIGFAAAAGWEAAERSRDSEDEED